MEFSGTYQIEAIVGRVLGWRLPGSCFATLVLASLLSHPCFADTPIDDPLQLVLQTGHGSEITSLDFDPTSRWLISTEADGVAKLWDTQSRQLIRSFSIPAVSVGAFSPSEQQYLVGGLGRSKKKRNLIILSELTTGREIRRWDGGGGLMRAAGFNPSGELLATTAGSVVHLWDPHEGRHLDTLRVHTDSVWALAFSHNGKLLATGDWQGHLIIWDVATRTIVQRFKNKSSATSLSFSPDDRWIVSVSQSYGIVLRELETGQTRGFQDSGLDFSPHSVAFSPDGRFIAAGGLRRVGLWEVRSGTLFKTLEVPDYGHTTWVKVVAFDSTGQFLSAGTDQHDVFLWNLASAYEGGRLGTKSSGVDKIALSEDGTTSAFAFRDEPLIVWRHQAGGGPKALDSMIKVWPEALALSHDGSWFATVDALDNLRIRRTSDGQEKDAFKFENISASLSFSPFGKWLVATGSGATKKGGKIRIENMSTGRKSRSLRHTQPSLAIFAHDERRMVSAGNTSVKLWDLKNRKEIRTYSGHKSFIQALAISPNDLYLAVSSFGGQIKVWDMNSNRLIVSLEVYGGANAIDFSSDSRQLAVADRGKVAVFEIPSGRWLFDLTGQSGTIKSIAFTPDGKKLIAVSNDATIGVWNAKLGHEIARLVVLHSGSGRTDWIAMDKDGFFDGTRAAWQAVPVQFRSEPLKLYEPEQFFNQFYQPGMIADIFRESASTREILKRRGDPRANLDITAYRNSKIPELRVVPPSSGRMTSSRIIDVTIEAKDTGGGIRDLRVFRNHSLVHFEHGDLQPNPLTKIFRLSVPITLTAGENEISAYAFNRNNIRNKAATISVTGADGLKRKGTVYILAIGISDYANPSYNLNYADKDAKALVDTLEKGLKRLKVYRDVVSVELLNANATKTNILAAISRLGSKNHVNLHSRDTPRELQDLKKAEPEDTVIVFFSGHGTANGDRYYLIPHDMGYMGDRERIDAAGRQSVINHSVSDQDLEKYFEEVDAGKIMIIIDACQSGQALESEERRRGPMNSRGLAQLAYEKGMYVLAAAQSYQAALEFEKLGHGLLTYVLVELGLKDRKADSNPKDGRVTAEEWLDYAVRVVPLEIEAASEKRLSRTGKGIDYGEETVTGQAPRAYYRRERFGEEWVVWQQR